MQFSYLSNATSPGKKNTIALATNDDSQERKKE